MTTHQPKIPEQVRSTSHGRGGAGNINSKPSETIGADDLKTPILKSQTYTTGRGGSGNMANNSSALEARKAQDVEAPAHHQNEPKGTYHWGRGGEGNKMTIGSTGDKRGKSNERKEQLSNENGTKRRTSSASKVLEKGKEMLGLKGKTNEKGGSAVVDD